MEKVEGGWGREKNAVEICVRDLPSRFLPLEPAREGSSLCPRPLWEMETFCRSKKAEEEERIRQRE